ncbi:MAG TPA: hypothetical protein VK879_07040 [Candidatus Sulfomarinibacteraceae bacterium]|nr:hypothetical protein [Candidatus Sulfomarinibacteraceae bacterium]
MAQRILTVSGYLFRQLLFSLTGVIYIVLTLAFWRIFFDPSQSTPDSDYYILVIGLFGMGAAFLVTLSVAARAHRASNYPLIVRLPSRVEHLSAVLVASLSFSLLLQILVALLATISGPSLSLGNLLEIPPLWFSADLLAVVLALHASDLVTMGWSRVYVYGILAVFLFGQQLDSSGMGWISQRMLGIGNWFFRQGWAAAGNLANSASHWLNGNGSEIVSRLFSAIFWPFDAISSAVIAGSFRPPQALAPALLILYATFLFVLAAELFASKDLHLTE